MPSEPASRALALLGLLQTGGEWGGDELARRLATSARTVRRDIGRLRTLGYAVDARPGPGGHYRLGAGQRVPPLLFAEDEVLAVVAALRMVEHRFGDGDPSGRALGKLERLLPPRLAARAAATQLVTEVVPDRSPPIDLDTVATLATAASTDGRVRFTYVRRDGERSTRLVDPYRQVVHRGRWTLLGWDTGREDWRVFRIDRISELTRVAGTYARRDLPAESAAAFLGSNFAQPPIGVSVVFHTDRADVERRLSRPDGELTALDGGRTRYTTRVGDLDWFAANLAVLALPFDVEQPAALTERCRTLAAVLARDAGVRIAAPRS